MDSIAGLGHWGGVGGAAVTLIYKCSVCNKLWRYWRDRCKHVGEPVLQQKGLKWVEMDPEETLRKLYPHVYDGLG